MSLKYEPAFEPLHISSMWLFSVEVPLPRGEGTPWKDFTTRAEDAPGTPTQSHISPSILVFEQNCSSHVRIPDVTVLYVPSSLDVIRHAGLLGVRRSDCSGSAAERRGDTSRRFRGFYLKVKALIVVYVPCSLDSGPEMCSGSEAGSYLRLIDVCITQL